MTRIRFWFTVKTRARVRANAREIYNFKERSTL